MNDSKQETYQKNSSNLEHRHINSKYEKFNKRTDANHFESKESFRKKFSAYSILQDEIIMCGKDLWDNNLGGIPVDYDEEKKLVYVDSSEAHTLLIGSTGSKKSRLMVMPLVNILASAGESMIISDPKAEIYHRCAYNLKEKGYNIHVINFRDPKLSDGWNFLAYPYQLYKSGEIDKACELVNDAAANLMPMQAKDPYWDYSARDLFVGLTLLLFEICLRNDFPDKAVNIQNILDLRANMFKDSGLNDFDNYTQYYKIISLKSYISNKLIGITELEAKSTRSCILSTFDQHLSCFSISPQLSAMFSTTTFSFDDIGYNKTALFIILPDEKTTFHKLAVVFIKQCYEKLLGIAYNCEHNNRFPVRINYVLDEFSSLPKINDFTQMIAASRSRNIRFHLVMQSKKQLIQKYENETETIQSNCGNWMFLYSKELELLREISDLAGKKGNKQLIPMYQLQHLDKEKGQCLIFSNRLYPYYSYIPDIDEYPCSGKGTLDFPKLEFGSKTFNLISILKKRLSARLSDRIINVDTNNDEYDKSGEFTQEESSELQKELEAKFDELFGSQNDDDNNN